MSDINFTGKPKRIAIDARAISHPQPGGFKTYTENVVAHLPHYPGVVYDILLDRPYAVPAFLDRPDFCVRVIHSRPAFLGMPFRENILLPLDFRKNKVDLAHFPCGSAAYRSPCPFIITIHDAIEWMPPTRRSGNPSLKRTLMHLYNRTNQRRAAQSASAIITVSSCSKRDIIKYLNVPEEKIFVTYGAPKETFFQPVDGDKTRFVLSEFKIAHDYILGIGSADPRKNIQCLIRAYAELPSDLKQRYKLVLVMTHRRLQEDLVQLARSLGILEQVQFLNDISTENLAFLYHGAALFVFPSLYEGFGLPPLEAMACGTAVVAANNSSIPEIVDDAALLVNHVAGDGVCSELVEKISKVLYDPSLRITLSQRGLERVRHFSWKRCASETTKIYLSVLKY
jgi:glycosyltransferase involved in cell wall biosynthesis